MFSSPHLCNMHSLETLVRDGDEVPPELIQLAQQRSLRHAGHPSGGLGLFGDETLVHLSSDIAQRPWWLKVRKYNHPTGLP